MTYTLLNSNQPPIPGLRFRPSRPGPESDLVEEFLATFKINTPANHSVTLFQEPGLESGFPDIVVVIWHQVVAEKWNPERLNLHNGDIRVLHHLASTKPMNQQALETLFGSKVVSSLNRLEAAEMIRRTKSNYSALPLSKIYATHSIIAVEAKMTQWRSALDQAFTNRWFASQSVILLPKVPKGSMILAEAESLGVDVWTLDESAKQLNGQNNPTNKPISYASWLFNEWALRAIVR